VLLLAVSIGMVGMMEEMHSGCVQQQDIWRHWHYYCFSLLLREAPSPKAFNTRPLWTLWPAASPGALPRLAALPDTS
jgi:hypothetical protein